jgi:hypothetical protein
MHFSMCPSNLPILFIRILKQHLTFTSIEQLDPQKPLSWRKGLGNMCISMQTVALYSIIANEEFNFVRNHHLRNLNSVTTPPNNNVSYLYRVTTFGMVPNLDITHTYTRQLKWEDSMSGFQLFNQTYVSDLYGTHIQIYAAETDLEN